MVQEANQASIALSLGSVQISTRIYQLLSWKDNDYLLANQDLLLTLLEESEQRGLLSQWGVVTRFAYPTGLPSKSTPKS